MKTIFLMFWANWDLAKKKLFPALYNIYKNNFTENLDIVWIGRRDYTRQDFIDYIKKESKPYLSDEDSSEDFFSELKYSKLDLTQEEDYYNLKKYIQNLDDWDSQIIIYLSISPEYYFDFIENSKILDLKGNVKIIFEKPFGTDLNSAKELESKIKEVFSEEQTYIIDHYVGKEPIQNILTFRFANILFEPIWNSNYIDNIQISATEEIWVGTRWAYYEKSWALRDMVQNHLMQMIALVAMDAPAKLDSDSISAEKLKILKSINLGKDFNNKIVFGQYEWYKQETWVDPNSRVETFVAMKLEIENYRFKWVPIYLKTWKALDKKSTKIVINFKKLPSIFKEFWEICENRIILEVQPNEWISIHFNIKEEWNAKSVKRVHSIFKKELNSKEAYQKLIEDVIVWDKSLFTSFDILKESWKIVDDIINCKDDCPIIYEYKKWTKWPQQSDELLKNEWREWYE